MRAVAIADDRSLRLVQVPEPGLRPDEVRIAVSFCGICGSDLHMREMPAIPPGIVLGHEFTGVITETGTGAGTDQLPGAGLGPPQRRRRGPG